MSSARLTTTSLRWAPRLRDASHPRMLHYARHLQNEIKSDVDVIDALAEGDARGRTGGGERLSSSSKNAPPQPKISNLSVPGNSDMANLTEAQRREVEEHNKHFEAKHDHGSRAPADKVNKKFWKEERRQ